MARHWQKGRGHQGQPLPPRQPSEPVTAKTELLQGLMAFGCNPAAEISALLQSPDLPPDEKLTAWEKMLPYFYSSRKAIDPDGMITPEQMAELLNEQAEQVRVLLEKEALDPERVQRVLAGLQVPEPVPKRMGRPPALPDGRQIDLFGGLRD